MFSAGFWFNEFGKTAEDDNFSSCEQSTENSINYHFYKMFLTPRFVRE